ncbi:hypothetical protein RvY_07672 [Ramazzottius varieornatus]|uniref:histone acetyltransferase n=1 Tax=Ramazzottius varieornatus TaxID=947166 RepID=A0A1D1V310_RAMVA|nr:hypothetical protein RvY_07672 [Ramazzottius varieornatus]
MDLTDRKRKNEDDDQLSPSKKTLTDEAALDLDRQAPDVEMKLTNGTNGHVEEGADQEEPSSPELILDLAKIPDEFKANGLNIIKMRIVHEDGISASNTKDFKPLFVYQFFAEPRDEADVRREEEEALQVEQGNGDGGSEDGEDGAVIEQDEDTSDATEGLIVGFKNLKVELYFTPVGLKPYIVESSSELLPPDQRSVQDIVKAVEEGYGEQEVMKTEETFLQAVKKEQNFQPFGTKIWSTTQNGGGKNGVEVYEVGADSIGKGYPDGFSEYLKGIQPFLKWFIYASSIITAEHTKWLHYFMYEKPTENTFRLVGYCSVYRYTVWPKKIDDTSGQFGNTVFRCRIAQFLILPPYQKAGYGTQLLLTILKNLQQVAYEITVEEATPEFQRLFDTATTFMVNQHVTGQDGASVGSDLTQWYSRPAIKDLRKKLKFSPRTLKQCLDILACQSADRDGASTVRQFRNRIQTELKKKIEKNIKEHEKSLERTVLGYYSVAEGDKAEEDTLKALWNVNLNDQIQKEQTILETDELDSMVRSIMDRYQKVSKRMENIRF